jgi:hypothetical protein
MTATGETRASVVRHARCGCRKLRKKEHKIPQSSQPFTGLWKPCAEDFGLRARLVGMLRLAVTLVFLVALAGATVDLARGRRPVLFG